jgi:uncharacterized protein (TIGR03083 family)
MERSEATERDVNLATITNEGRRLLEFALRDPERVVPHYPSWTQRDLVMHTASVHASTAAICIALPQERPAAAEPPADRDPFDWYEESLRALVEALHGSDPDAEVYFFTADRTVRAWERRMVIETGVHRWDAQGAIENPDPLLPIVSTHGLDEFADMYLRRLDGVPTLEVTATDTGESWKFGGGAPVATALASASDLYLRLMARAGARLPIEWERAVDAITSAAG